MVNMELPKLKETANFKLKSIKMAIKQDLIADHVNSVYDLISLQERSCPFRQPRNF
jgi:hypothetical protein